MEEFTPSLLFAMLRDSFLYFGLLFLLIIVDLIIWTNADVSQFLLAIFSAANINSTGRFIRRTSRVRPFHMKPYLGAMSDATRTGWCLYCIP
jgi:hypothetical protein